jgi:NAD(P)-dependent dehydrogenase (short-subunit alcohol dehydrogenase family)
LSQKKVTHFLPTLNPYSYDKLTNNLDMSNNIVAATADNRFLGKTIIITGAGGNFGREGCIYFARRGAKIAAIDVNQSALDETLAEVNAAVIEMETNVRIHSYICDVTDPESVEKTVSSISVDFQNKIDMLWNNAGYQGQIKPTLDYDPVDFARVMSINVTGMFIVLQSVAKRMASQQALSLVGNSDSERGVNISHPFTIVNTASVAALRGTPAMVAYASSKAAILAMTVSTAKDLAPHGIRVNAISPALIGPGVLWTRQNELHASSGSPYFSTDPEQVAKDKIGG